MIRFCFAVLGLLLLAVNGTAAHLALKPCHPEGIKQEVRCGMLVVPENRAKPQGRKLALEVIVVPAWKRPAKEPIFFLDGGPGQIALHGRDNVGGTLGSAESHGCIRLDDAAIEWLVGRIGAGTPVAITA